MANLQWQTQENPFAQGQQAALNSAKETTANLMSGSMLAQFGSDFSPNTVTPEEYYSKKYAEEAMEKQQLMWDRIEELNQENSKMKEEFFSARESWLNEKENLIENSYSNFTAGSTNPVVNSYRSAAAGSNFKPYEFKHLNQDNHIDKTLGVDPRLLQVMDETYKATGIKFRFVEGVRTQERQQQLYAQGRTSKGNIVTYVDGVKSKSKHQIGKSGFGSAVDIVLLDEKGRVTYNGERYTQFNNYVQENAKRLGIGVRWGGTFKKLDDRPHFELR